jgi:SAM-dependent methyltransferase
MLHDHFSVVANRYRDLRTTDPEPVLFIRDQLPRHPCLGVDVGCGTGRYTEKLYYEMPEGTLILAVDRNPGMLRTLKARISEEEGIQPFQANAEDLPLLPGSVDWLTSFNAVHHLDLQGFLWKTADVLKAGGKMFIYTRTPEQNARSIWGRFFPGFTEKETRLRSEPEFREAIGRADELQVESVETFRYSRTSTVDRLREQAENAHYSTFCLFGRKEFSEALGTFLRRLPGPVVSWYDENLMLVCERRR